MNVVRSELQAGRGRMENGEYKRRPERSGEEIEKAVQRMAGTLPAAP